MRRPVALATLALASVPLPVLAQSLTPMAVSVGSYGDRFMTRLEVANPYAAAREFHIVAYDEQGQPLALWADAAQFSLRAGSRRKVMITAPFDGMDQRNILVCAETRVEQVEGAHIRAQVCSKVKGRKL